MNRLSLKFLVCVVLLWATALCVDSQGMNTEETAVEQSVARNYGIANTRVDVTFEDGSAFKLFYDGYLSRVRPGVMQSFEYHAVERLPYYFDDIRQGTVIGDSEDNALEIFRTLFLKLQNVKDVKVYYYAYN